MASMGIIGFTGMQCSYGQGCLLGAWVQKGEHLGRFWGVNGRECHSAGFWGFFELVWLFFLRIQGANLNGINGNYWFYWNAVIPWVGVTFGGLGAEGKHPGRYWGVNGRECHSAGFWGFFELVWLFFLRIQGANLNGINGNYWFYWNAVIPWVGVTFGGLGAEGKHPGRYWGVNGRECHSVGFGDQAGQNAQCGPSPVPAGVWEKNSR